MTDNDNASPIFIKTSPYYIKNGRLYIGSDNNGHLQLTHVQVRNADGEGCLKLFVSGNKISARWGVGDRHPFFTATVTPEGHLEGERPKGYQFVFFGKE